MFYHQLLYDGAEKVSNRSESIMSLMHGFIQLFSASKYLFYMGKS
nr:unnamed protein product [Callosobruchus chinensis]